MARKKKKIEVPRTYNKEVEDKIGKMVYDQYQTAKRNQDPDNADFEAIIDLMECKRTERDYEWMSDVFIPKYPAIHLTEASMWANQYFQTRDFVEVYLEGDNQLDKLKANAAKKYINGMLNTRELYHYSKYMRARSINSTRGYVLAICDWVRKERTVVTGTEDVQTGEDEYGYPVIEQRQKTAQVPIEDRFNYEVLDPRNVFMDNTYCYSIQDKEWVIIRSETTYEQLKAKERENGYFNLDAVYLYLKDAETETTKETKEKQIPVETDIQYCDVLLRLGKVWSIVNERDDEGNPVSSTPGYDEAGDIIEEAELIESIVEIAVVGSYKVPIRWQPTPFRTKNGQTYRPIIRGLCYVHPTKDVGMSSGKYSRELQVALNDTINMSNDRVKLSTFPTISVRKHILDDNDTLFFEPEHAMVRDQKDDIVEFRIDDNIQGAMQQASMFINAMEQVEAIYPTTMGNIPEDSSVTATAVAGAEQRTNIRSNYKSLTFEYTFLTEFYWMMLQMGYQFMHPMTAMKIMGSQAQFFDPDANYTYKPVSSSIELEYSKDRKIKNYDQMVGRIAALAKITPDVMPIIAYAIAEQLKLLGSEYQDVAKQVGQLANARIMPEGQGQMGGSIPDQGQIPMSNQQGIPMSQMEMQTRGME